jgi:nucleolar MIF4G domain-containing protein 1
MLQAVYDVKNNRKRREDEEALNLASSRRKRVFAACATTTRALSKAGGSSGARSGGDAGAEPLVVSVDDLLATDTVGRWWITGAAWTGRDTGGGDGASSLPGSNGKTNAAHGSGGDAGSSSTTGSSAAEIRRLHKLARKHGMSTDVQRSLFTILMSSADPRDAQERIDRLALKGKQEREIVSVLMHCCGAERTFNPYYAELAHILCTANHNHKFTFQYAYWDLLRAAGETSARRLVNLARLFSHLVGVHALSLSALRAAPFDSVEPRVTMFLRAVITALCLCFHTAAARTAVERVCKVKDLRGLRAGLVLTLHGLADVPDALLKAVTVGTDEPVRALRERLAERTAEIRHLLEAADIFGV